MSAVHPVSNPIATPSTSPDRLGAGLSSSSSSPTLPALTPDQDRLFEALAKGQTSPAELSATLDLPVRHILNLLATPEITFHLQVLESAIDYLARHTARLRHNLAFKSLESALTTAAAKDNPGEIRRIATLLLKPTPPLPDPEAEQAERAERITKHRRAVKNDARSEQKDAEYTALAAAMVTGATDRLSSSGRCSVPATRAPQASHAHPQSSSTRPQSSGGPNPGLVPPDGPVQPATQATPAAPAPQSPSHWVTVSPSHSSPAQPRAA